ncbi:DNA cytosine methyltransferase [Enterococcus sp. 5H]|uniref:DNA cytosine methyltransferase n=1 Tax=Enterococcus sp. 5H TaxID=1229490 RepID=UPI00230221B7|nr:DNA cytosine methyltransferase [Enterococcus sp. 5H]
MYNIIDLFAGAGGLSLGFSENKNFNIVAAVEKDKYARETYIYNHKNENIDILSDVREVDYFKFKEKFGTVDVIIGGPPCQGFSNVNRQKNNIINSNNILVKEYVRAVKALNPKVFIMENVKMLTSEKHRFYYSKKDQAEIDFLDLALRSDHVFVTNGKYKDFDILEIARCGKYGEYLIKDSLYNLLNTLFRKKRDTIAVEKFLDKNLQKIENLMEIDKSNSSIFAKDYDLFLSVFRTRKYSINFFDHFDSFINFQKGIKIIEELKRNEIIATYFSKDNVVYAEVQSYSVVDYLNEVFKENYEQTVGVVNAINYGVPQKRKRFILSGVRKDLNYKDISQIYKHTSKEYTVRDAIEDLEKIKPELEVNSAPKGYIQNNLCENEFLKEINDSDLIYNHVVTATREKALERFRTLKEGENFHNLDKSLKDTYTNPERTQNTIYLRVSYDRPAGTVVNVRKSMWIHPVLNRAISIREAARLQSFPDSFVFKGTKDSQYQQIGNAVPPKLSAIISKTIFELLRINENR